MEFRQLRYLIEIEKYGTISRAAENLCVTQPSVSKSIQLLEDELGKKLFDRAVRGIKLNPVGKAVAEQARNILESCDRILEICQSEDNLANTNIKILVSAANAFVADAVSKFIHDHPNVKVSISHSSPRNEKGDIFISSSRRKWMEKNHVSIVSEDLAVAVPPNHVLAKQSSVTIKELAQYPLISLQHDLDMRMGEELFEKTEKVTFQRKIECENPDTLCSLVEKGMGPAIIPTKTWPEIEKYKIQLCPISGCNCVRYINIERIGEKSEAYYVKLLYEHIIRCVHEWFNY